MPQECGGSLRGDTGSSTEPGAVADPPQEGREVPT